MKLKVKVSEEGQRKILLDRGYEVEDKEVLFTVVKTPMEAIAAMQELADDDIVVENWYTD